MEKVALLGRQVLEAILFLYKVGFQTVGHVHSGNIFMATDTHCKLGGYENALLGYRTRLYRACSQEGYLNNIDLIMFGECSASWSDLPWAVCSES